MMLVVGYSRVSWRGGRHWDFPPRNLQITMSWLPQQLQPKNDKLGRPGDEAMQGLL